MQLFLAISLLSCCTIFSSYSQEDTYPTPERLFHIERSKNRNIVCYDVKLASDGAWNPADPIKIYWVNREEDPGKTNDLNFIQKSQAYGSKLHLYDDRSCTISLKACPDRQITLTKKDGKYSCHTLIKGQLSELKKIYVQTQKSNSLKVEYVELSGIDLKTGESVSEPFSK